MLPRSRVLVLVFACVSAPGWAETCKYVDAEGRIIYSNTPNTPPKGAKKVKCFEDPTPKPPPAAATPRSSDSSRASNSPDNKGEFPKVDGQTQKKRDDERRRILERELTDEQQRLENAKQQLTEQESVRTGDERNYQRFLDRVQPYRDAVASHERNIESIRREIANLK